MNFNIYRRKDGRYEGRLNIGKKADGKIQYKYVYGQFVRRMYGGKYSSLFLFIIKENR